MILLAMDLWFVDTYTSVVVFQHGHRLWDMAIAQSPGMQAGLYMHVSSEYTMFNQCKYIKLVLVIWEEN